jgi:hypothetical protein
MSENRPGAEMSAAQVATVLEACARVVRANDSDEGYIRYWRPEIRIYDREYDALPDSQKAWYERGENQDHNVFYEHTQAVEYVLRDDAPNVFLVTAFYRVGNSMGQGGAVIIDAETFRAVDL